MHSQHVLQSPPNTGPLVIDDAEPDRISLSSIRHDALVADDAFLRRAQAEYCRAGFFIDFICGELNAHAVEMLKGVAQHEKFRLGVDERLLPGSGDPRTADFQFSVLLVDLPKAG